MLDFLKRGQLVRRGLASKKTRRRRTRNELLHTLEHSVAVKVLLIGLFAGGLAFLVFSGQQPELTKNFVIALLFLATALVQLWINQPKTFSRSSRILLVFGIMLLQLAVTKLLLVVCNSGHYRVLKPGDSRSRYALCLRTAGHERLARTESRPLRSRFRQPIQQCAFRRDRRAIAGNKFDQRLHRCFVNPAGSTPQSSRSGRLRRGPGHLALCRSPSASSDRSIFFRWRRTTGA